MCVVSHWCVVHAEADRLMEMGSEAEKRHLLQSCQPHKGRGPGSFGRRDPFLQRSVVDVHPGGPRRGTGGPDIQKDNELARGLV